MAPTETPSQTAGTQHQFAYEWERFPEIVPHHQEQFRRWIGTFSEEGFAGKTFLDAGCGMGRNAYWALKAGARAALCIDYDERTLAAARNNLAEFPHCEVRYQSIYDLDEPEKFDVAFAIGVIHHLAEPRRAIENLVSSLVPGGSLILWLYGREGNELYLALVDPVRRHLTSKLPPALTHGLARALTVALKAYLALPHRRAYEKLLRQHSFRQLEAIVLDQLIPTIANYWTRADVLDLIAGLPLENVQLTHTNGMSWSVVAVKAAP